MFTRISSESMISPMYNQDLETGCPETVNRFTREIANADALLFVTPEC